MEQSKVKGVELWGTLGLGEVLILFPSRWVCGCKARMQIPHRLLIPEGPGPSESDALRPF